ncbi:glycosyltransferase [Flavobacteriaceae bacterium]|nr:glycosyltransferase [Flavobacteriaceae bacterium]
MRSKKTIVYIGNFSFPNGNASGSRVLGNGYIFRELGYKVVYIGLDNNLNQNSELSETLNEYDSFKFYNLSYPKSAKDWFLFKKSYFDVQKLIIEIDPEIVVLYGSPRVSIFAKLLKSFCKLKNIRFVMDIVDWLAIYDGNIIFRIVKYLDINYLKKHIANDADGIISISSYLKRYYSKKVKNIIVIPPLSGQINLENLNNGGNEIKKLIYVGTPFSLSKRNLKENYFKDRLDLVIDYLSTLLDVEFIFNIYGITLKEYLFVVQKHKDVLEKLKNKIIFHGKVSNLEAKNKISKADFSILFRNVNKMTSAGFPTKVSESISCGTPVITNSTSDLEHYIINGKNGFLVNLNSKSLTNELTNILTLTISEVDSMKTYCFNDNLFSPKKYIQSTNDFLNKLKIK